ncbi:hypothetical protein [Nonomuraea glycinis]|uniref:hypothetical protein n=1 Tax=Nonomuraea glycinis TaxID=2047744 RepID=UPI0033BF2B0C
MSPTINDRFVLVQDGVWMYYLGDAFAGHHYGIDKATAYADGQPMTELNGTRWWAATAAASEITVHIPQPDRVIGYILSDPTAESERFPTSLTRERFRELANSSDIWHDMYKPVREPADPKIVTVPGPWTVLEDAPLPPADTSPTWQATLPTALTQRREYQHLFPGYLTGLRATLVDRIKAMPYVTYVFDKDHQLDVTIEVPLELPEHEWVTPYQVGRRRPKPYQRQITVTRRLSLPVPDRVPGDNYAAALKVWDDEIERWTGIVASASAKGCNTCHGRGYILDGAEQHART